MENTRKEVLRSDQLRDQKKEAELLYEINKVSQELGAKIQDLVEARCGWYDEEFFKGADLGLITEYDNTVQHMADIVAIVDEVSHDLKSHKMSLKNIFNL